VTRCEFSSASCLDSHRQWHVDLGYGGVDILPPADPANVRLESSGCHRQPTREAQGEHQRSTRGASARLRPIIGRHSAAGDPYPTALVYRETDRLRGTALIRRPDASDPRLTLIRRAAGRLRETTLV